MNHPFEMFELLAEQREHEIRTSVEPDSTTHTAYTRKPRARRRTADRLRRIADAID